MMVMASNVYLELPLRVAVLEAESMTANKHYIMLKICVSKGKARNYYWIMFITMNFRIDKVKCFT